MKRFSKMFFVCLMALALCLSVGVLATEGPLTLTLEPESAAVEAGQTVTVVFAVTENPEIVRARFAIHYDPEALRLLSVSTDFNQFAADTVTADTSAAGKVQVDLGALYEDESQGHTATGQLLCLTFETVEGFTGQTELRTQTDMDVLTGTDPEAGTLTVQEASCTITVTEPDTHIHTEEVIPQINATCTEPGWTEGVKCSECGDILVAPQYIEPNGHTPGESVPENLVPASCQTDGSYESVVYCSICGEELSRETVIVPTTGEHNYINEQERIDPTCTEDGSAVMACACGQTQTITLPATGHKEVTDPGYAATCTEPGLSDGSYCEVCGQTLTVGQEIPAKGHTEQVQPGYASTCTETGLTDGTICADCGVILVAQEEMPLAEHSPELVPGIAPTCTEPGLTEGTACAFCGMEMTAREEIPATGHVHVQVSAVAATCSAEGHTAGTRCGVCGDILSGCETVAKLPHTESVLEAQEPTCAEAGKSEGKYCTVCGEITQKQTLIPALEHTAEVIPAVEPTCSAYGWTEGTRCSVCGEILEDLQQIPMLEHTRAELEGYPATCSAPGMTQGASCSVCGAVIEQQQEIPPLEHVYDNNCDPNCNVCNATRVSLQHDFSNWFVVREATADAAGEQARTCRQCGYRETQMLAYAADRSNRTWIIVAAYIVMGGSALGILMILRKRRKTA